MKSSRSFKSTNCVYISCCTMQKIQTCVPNQKTKLKSETAQNGSWNASSNAIWYTQRIQLPTLRKSVFSHRCSESNCLFFTMLYIYKQYINLIRWSESTHKVMCLCVLTANPMGVRLVFFCCLYCVFCIPYCFLYILWFFLDYSRVTL